MDYAFLTSRDLNLGMNYLRFKMGTAFPVSKRLGYLADTRKLLEREDEIGIQSSWFFRTITRPFKELEADLLAKGHEIAFHAERIENESFFMKDLKTVAKNVKIIGFTKHGSRGLPSPPPVRGEMYNPELCIERAKNSGLSYFCGNDVVPTDASKIVNGIVFFPSVFWVGPGYMDDSKFSVEWLIEYQKDHDVVVLIHPSDAIKGLPTYIEKVESIYSRCDEFVSFKKYLEIKKIP